MNVRINTRITQVSSTAVGGHPNNTQAVAEFQEQYYSTADLKQFMQTYSAKYAKSYTVHLYGNNDESDPGVEASLDIQVRYMALKTY
jgi:hypothetical protein